MDRLSGLPVPVKDTWVQIWHFLMFNQGLGTDTSTAARRDKCYGSQRWKIENVHGNLVIASLQAWAPESTSSVHGMKNDRD